MSDDSGESFGSTKTNRSFSGVLVQPFDRTFSWPKNAVESKSSHKNLPVFFQISFDLGIAKRTGFDVIRNRGALNLWYFNRSNPLLATSNYLVIFNFSPFPSRKQGRTLIAAAFTAINKPSRKAKNSPESVSQIPGWTYYYCLFGGYNMTTKTSKSRGHVNLIANKKTGTKRRKHSRSGRSLCWEVK